jgi:acyl carrier protein
MREPGGRTAPEVERTVRRLVAEVLWLPEAELGGATPLVEFGLDSPLAMELAVRMEETFAVSLPEDVVARLQTIDDIVDYLAAGTA